MKNDLENSMQGILSAVTPCGRFGIVTLDHPQQGHSRAVINDETRGRIAMMSASKNGRLEVGKRVTIDEAEKGSEAFRILKVAYL